ncbi:hypothetical protein IscW_ISCW004908 [Ixodes scapularis]|uniref:Uncharacterized protein n=1 Tax=Ixodes scapularis TaxID=6945 RepID=B7PJV3_IXOSC|nr:hypothetical protein IscW_ISCW004908 [Ixodes scapularis]|eukprot:XP_002408707.1 hypothetical protein IscW_ISCW004908 [Ixodes scapularis]
MPFATRLRSYLHFHLEARGIQTKDDLIDLLVAVQLKARMSPEALSYVTLKEDPSWHRAPELSRLMRLYEQSEGRGAASKSVDAESSGALDQTKGGGAADTTKFTRSPAARLGTGQRKECYGCGALDHLRADCPHATSRRENGSLKAPSKTEKLTARVTTELRSPPPSGLITTRISCGEREIDAVLDTGADITVVREAIVPDELTTPCGKISLESAFGESVEASLVLLPLAFLDRGSSFAEVRETAPILRALTDRLTSRTDCLLSGEAWETLHGATIAEAPVGAVASVAAGEAAPSAVGSPAREPDGSIETKENSTETEVEECAETSSWAQTDDTETDDGFAERSKFGEQQLGDPSLLEAGENGREGRVQGIGVTFQENDDFGELECTPRKVRGCRESQLPDGETVHIGRDGHIVRAVFDRHRRLFSPNTGIAKVGERRVARDPGYVPRRAYPYRIPEMLGGEFGLSANVEKCQVAKPDIRYLGHAAGSGKHASDPAKLAAIEGLLVPTTKQALRAYGAGSRDIDER